MKMPTLPKNLTTQSGGINIYDTKGNISGEFVGRDKIIYGLDETKLIELLDIRGLIRREDNYLLKMSDELDDLAGKWISIAKYMSGTKKLSAEDIREQLARQSTNYAALKTFVANLYKIKDRTPENCALLELLKSAVGEKDTLYILLGRYIDPEWSFRGEGKEYSHGNFTPEYMQAALELTGGRRLEAIKLLRETEPKKAIKKTKSEIASERKNIAKEVAMGAEEIAFIAGKFRALVHSP